MIGNIMHVGITVTDLDRSIAFYRDVLGLQFAGQLLMEGPETEKLFRKPDCRAKVAYLHGGKPPMVELIQFVPSDVRQVPGDLFMTSISELCLETDDIEETCSRLRQAGVELLSAPQPFDFTESGFGKSKAVYFRDPDGVILELMETCS